jgi:hypothetical protein
MPVGLDDSVFPVSGCLAGLMFDDFQIGPLFDSEEGDRR